MGKARGSCAVLALSVLVLSSACSIVYRRVGGDFDSSSQADGGIPETVSPRARDLIRAAFAGLPAGRVVDLHVHAVGVGSGDSGIYLNPEWQSVWHPIKRARTAIYMSAAGVSFRSEDPDRDYMDRLLRLMEAFPTDGRFFLYALDWACDRHGNIDRERTSFRVPNEYVFEQAMAHPDRLVPVISLHPLRPDAVERLRYWAARGCRFVKWLPNAMGIDPGSARVMPFYEALRELDMVLLVHTGAEHAVDASEWQHLGNPLLLRRPLDAGVKVVALHAAATGYYADLDDPARREVSGFELFLRLMDEPRHEGRLFGEISAITFFNHLSEPLQRLLERRDLHARLLNGSDYPLPGINLLTQTSQLVRLGFLDAPERETLNEVYEFNPLLFDFLVKRRVRHPGTGDRFSVDVFQLPPELEPWPLEPREPGRN